MILCPAQPFDLPAIMMIEHSAFIPPLQERRRLFDERLALFPQGFFVLADTSEETVRAHGHAVTAGYFCSERWAALPAPLAELAAGRTASGNERDTALPSQKETLRTAPCALDARDASEDRTSLPVTSLQTEPSARVTSVVGSSGGTTLAIAPAQAKASIGGVDAVPRLLPRHEKALMQQFAVGHRPRKTHRNDGSVLYISSFALLSQYRGQGLGTSFFRAALAALCGTYTQLSRLVLIVSTEWQHARRIYDSLDFKPLVAFADFFPSLHDRHADGIVMTADADSFRKTTLATNGNGAIIIERTNSGQR